MAEILSVLQQDIRRPRRRTSEIGDKGERLAARYLEANGYRLVMANFKAPIGRNSRQASVTGEIDIVALDGEVLCFVEVKTKTSAEFADPVAAVTVRKQRQITRTARVYARIFRLQSMPRRFDVVSIVLAKDARPKIDLTKGFWSESKFRKKIWRDEIR